MLQELWTQCKLLPCIASRVITNDFNGCEIQKIQISRGCFDVVSLEIRSWEECQKIPPMTSLLKFPWPAVVTAATLNRNEV